MSSTRAKSLILLSVTLATLTASAADLRARRLPRLTIALGGISAAMLLTALAEAAPRPAAGLAVMTTIGAVLGAGPDAFRTLGELTGQTAPAGPPGDRPNRQPARGTTVPTPTPAGGNIR